MLQVERLSKTYADGTKALKEVSFSVESGEFVMILGKSGSGKSTLLRCINRLVEPTGGNVFLKDLEITAASPRQLRRIRRKIGMVFQQYNLVSRSSVLTNVLAGRLGYISPWTGLIHYFPKETVRLAQNNLREMELSDKCNQRAGVLSGGQQQRVGIARALMQDPELILADEPVSSLDPSTARTIMDILQKINRDRGVTILCNLHLPELAKEYGSRIMVLKAGEVVFDDLPEHLDLSKTRDIYETV